jgi:Bacterial archaeo-eukaryotic release factor family 2
VRTTEIARLFEPPGRSGKYVSLYLSTGLGRENAAQEMALRWKNARNALAGDGVVEPVLAAIDQVLIDPVTDEGRLVGPAVAVIAADDGVRWSGGLPAPLGREMVARYAPLPDVLPLLAAVQAQVPHLAVLTDRTGAEMVARLPDSGTHWDEQSEQVEGERTPAIHRSAPGGWSQRRYQQRAEVKWDQNAAMVAEALAKLADRTRPRFVAAAGDVRALQLLRDNAPKRLRDLLRVVGGEFHSIDMVLERAERLVAEEVAADTAALLGRFTEERAQGDLAAAGAPDTLVALSRSQVATLLLCDQEVGDRTAWFGPNPTELALQRERLAAAGDGYPRQGRLTDVAVRAALGTGADVRVLTPEEARDVPDGLSALLRYATT